MVTKAEKLTISIPHDLVELADEIAREKKVSRSKVVSSCLEELAKKRLQAKMEEGYKKMAEEHLEFAERSLLLANEVISDKKKR